MGHVGHGPAGIEPRLPAPAEQSARRAFVAAIHVKTFSQHAERVKMANIAQMVNAPLKMILTDDQKMVLTPTYYTFELYKPFEDADARCRSRPSAPTYQSGAYKVPCCALPRPREARMGSFTSRSLNLDPNNAAAARREDRAGAPMK